MKHSMLLFFLLCCVALTEALNTINLKHLESLLNAITAQYDCKTVIFIYHNDIPGNNSEFMTKLGKFLQSSSALKQPYLHYSEEDPFSQLNLKFDKDILLFVFIDGNRAAFQRSYKHVNTILYSLMDKLFASKVVLYFTNQKLRLHNTHLLQMFEYYFKGGFQNVLMTYDRPPSFGSRNTLKLFGYKPFPSIRILDHSQTFAVNPSSVVLYPNYLKNLEGYRIYSIVQQDPPRVFKYNTAENKTAIMGISAQVLLNFLQLYNGTFVEIPSVGQYLNMIEAIDAIYMGSIEILIHSNEFFDPLIVQSTYPYDFVDLCIIVPVLGEIPPYWYVILPFKYHVWVATVSFALLFLFLCFAMEYWLNRDHEFGITFSYVAALLLYLPPTASRVNTKTTKRVRLSLTTPVFFYTILFVYGFMMTNWYLAFLTTFLTTSVQSNEMNTLTDIAANNLNIMTTHYYKMMIYSGSHDGECNRLMTKLIKEASDLEVDMYASHLNNSFCYLMPTDKWEFYELQQSNFKHKLLRQSKTCNRKKMLSMIVHENSMFAEPLSDFIMKSLEFGLIEHWRQESFRIARKHGILQKPNYIDEPIDPISMEHVHLLFSIYLSANALAAVIFMIEHLRFYFGKTEL